MKKKKSQSIKSMDWPLKRPTEKKVEVVSKLPDAPLGVADGPSSAGWHKVEAGFNCFKEYQYKEVRKITNPLAQTPDPFAIGQMMHVGKARWFSKRFPIGEESIAPIREEMMAYAARAKLPMSLDAQRYALALFTEYVAHWSVRAKPHVIAAEYELGPSPLEPGDKQFLWRTARLDDVSKYPEGGDALFIGECKTASTSVADVIRQYSMHPQPLLQYLLWKVAPQGEAMHGPVAGVMLDVIIKGYGGRPSTFARTPLPFTPRALEWFAKAFRTRLRSLSQIDWDFDAPRNVAACTRMYGRARVACAYQEMCMHGRAASIKYVLPNGKSLLEWRPTEGQTVPPWE